MSGLPSQFTWGDAIIHNANHRQFREPENMTKRTWDPKQVERWRRAADHGDARAQYRLGVLYEYGQDVPEDQSEAARLYCAAAEQGHAEAQSALARMYEEGRGVEQDFVEAVKWYSRHAEQGNTGSCFHLALMYENGQHVQQDYVEAARWYREAAERGDAVQQFRLGDMYEKGQGVDHDYVEAARWYREAADQGFPAAQFRLGNRYENGRGVPQDYVLAHMYLNLAAAYNYDESFDTRYGDRGKAAHSRDCVATKMTPEQITEAQRLAREFEERLRVSRKTEREELEHLAHFFGVKLP